MKGRIFSFLVICAIVLYCFPAIGSGGTTDGGSGTLDLEINTGPEFDDTDVEVIKYCVKDRYWAFFPMDFLFNGPAIPLGSSECPSVTFFGHYEEFCWVLDTYRLISPGITLALLAYAIFNL